jgi:hypothetical protein
VEKTGYEKPILVRLGFDSEAKGTDACTTGPSVGTNNCNIGVSANKRCAAGTNYGQPTVCITGPAVS